MADEKKIDPSSVASWPAAAFINKADRDRVKRHDMLFLDSYGYINASSEMRPFPPLKAGASTRIAEVIKRYGSTPKQGS